MTIATDRLQPCDSCHVRRRTWAIEKPGREWRICYACLLAVIKRAEGGK